MNRSALERHLRQHGCGLVRNGRHAIWENHETGKRAPIPRHRTVKRGLARAICRQLGVPLPDGL